MSGCAFSSRALRSGGMCSREAVVLLESAYQLRLQSSDRRKIAMLPTCIGISGVSRYRNDASIEDSFLASLILSLPAQITRRLGGASRAPTLLGFRTLVRIVQSPEAHMQWQTAPIGQIA